MDSPPPAKRRRSSHGAPSTTAPSPPTASTSTSSSTLTTGSEPRTRAQRLAGFDDTQEDEDELRSEPSTGGTGARDKGKATEAAAGGALDRDGDDDPDDPQEDDDEEHCAICLSPIVNKTVVFPCHHGQFCWNCIRAWTDQSRKCPLCLGPIEHLIHDIRSTKDYSIHYLVPLHALTDSSPSTSSSNPLRTRRPNVVPTSLPRHALYGRSRHANSLETLDSPSWRERQEEIALERRKYIYREGLYAKHVASNRYTGFKPFTPQTFANNPELKSRVIKFIRRELQVFPAVDIAFLTTYLVSISSQLDLRSSSALRLISDFLSDQDAQHLVHEVTTFARSPFKTLEAYDRFVQYGRPERGEPKKDENERLVIDGELEERAGRASIDEPRFARNMDPRERDARRSNDGTGATAQVPPSVANVPPRPSSEIRRRERERSLSPLPTNVAPLSGGDRRDQRRSDAGHRDRSRDRGYASTGRGKGAMRSRREPEPDWRDRDARYRGSYYASSESRRDGGRRYERDRRDERDRTRRVGGDRESSRRNIAWSPSPDRRRGRSPSPPRHNRRRSLSRSPSHTRDRRRSQSRSRSVSRSRQDAPRPRSPTRSATLIDHSRRSRSPTPAHSPSHRSPTPAAPDAAQEPLEDDAISLTAPVLTPRPGSPVPDEPDAVVPSQSGGGSSVETRGDGPATLSIFGAARRLLGNGNVVTFSKEGRVNLQVVGVASARGEPDRNGKGMQGHAERSQRDERITEAYRPVPSSAKSPGPPRLSLLSRIAPASAAVPSACASGPVDKLETVSASPPVAATVDRASELRQKLQSRLTAEYRQALALQSKAPSAPTSSGAPAGLAQETDLRKLLRSRLQAEKALAYDSQINTSSSATGPVGPSSSVPLFSSHATSFSLYGQNSAEGGPHTQPVGWIGSTVDERGRTVFSQATRDLLMMRLEEEKVLAAQADSGGLSASFASVSDPQQEYRQDETTLTATTPVSSPTTALARAETSTPGGASKESGLRAKLLETKIRLEKEKLDRRTGELKERLMRDKLKKKLDAAKQGS
ncbi:hypothetical protein JCM10212_001085 [Sporobolomyces blumeae]